MVRAGRRRLTVTLTIVLVALVVVGAVAAWSIGRQHTPQVAEAGQVTQAQDRARDPGPDRAIRISADAREHPRSAEIRELLQGYFDSINNRDFAAWADSVGPMQRDSQDPQAWTHKYSTTVDSNVLVMSIADDPLRVRATFTSQQDPEFAPKDLPVDCISWDITYRLAEQGGGLVLDSLDPSATSMTSCG